MPVEFTFVFLRYLSTFAMADVVDRLRSRLKVIPNEQKQMSGKS